jgi:hypothetical protein
MKEVEERVDVQSSAAVKVRGTNCCEGEEEDLRENLEIDQNDREVHSTRSKLCALG